jgi:hypothetical protein
MSVGFFFIFKCASIVVGAIGLRLCYTNRESILFKVKFLWHYYTGKVVKIGNDVEPFVIGKNDRIEITNAFFINNPTGEKKLINNSINSSIKSEHIQKLLENIIIGNHDSILEYEGTSDDKLHVHYKYGSQNYRICLEHLKRPKETLSKMNNFSSKNICNEMTDVVLHRKVIGAYLKKFETIVDVTDIVKMHQGPFHDFHMCINGSSNKLIDIFHDYNLLQWDYLIIDDILGDQTVIDINPNSIEHICLELE